ncbi:hypothetical protein [Spiroplasma endosymbiont of Lonchoptera lutea]
MGYKHLGIDERIYIENQLKFKVKISEIVDWQPFLGHFLCRLVFSKFNGS